jgi:hypothetical protein
MKLQVLLISALASTACDDDDATTLPGDDDPTEVRDFVLRIENVAPWTVLKAGTQATRTTSGDGAIGPGQAYEIRFTAANQRLSFAAMLSESNDWFFAPGPDGIPLYTDGVPTSGDVTSFVELWDAGTELDQEPGVGDATGIRQRARDAGAADPNPNVRTVPVSVRLTDGTAFTRPGVASMIRVTLTPGPEQQFTLRIENVSRDVTLVTSQGTLPIHAAPFAWAVHDAPNALFTPGVPARENGLELLAEAGQPDALGTSLRNARGYATGLAPGIAVVHTQPSPLFIIGQPDAGVGLEALAEDGNQVPLADALEANPPAGVSAVYRFDTPVDGTLGPAAPGQAFELTIHGNPGEALSFATMFGMSNDWFFATRPEGIALFDNGIPRSCDVTNDVFLYDAGTEGDEELDVGPNTAPQQPAPNTGRVDRITEVREVTIERYPTPAVLHIRVTLRPLFIE